MAKIDQHEFGTLERNHALLGKAFSPIVRFELDGQKHDIIIVDRSCPEGFATKTAALKVAQDVWKALRYSHD